MKWCHSRDYDRRRNSNQRKKNNIREFGILFSNRELIDNLRGWGKGCLQALFRLKEKTNWKAMRDMLRKLERVLPSKKNYSISVYLTEYRARVLILRSRVRFC